MSVIGTTPEHEQAAVITTAGQGGGEPPLHRRAIGPTECGLAFDVDTGPLVVVCGLHGGAGTSTLAFTLAAQAAVESRANVLLCESDAAAGDIAALSQTRSPSSLSEMAIDLRAGHARRGVLARAGALRVIATDPRPAALVAPGDCAEVLRAARARHGLTVVDAGTLRASGSRELLGAATHIIWTTTIAQAPRADELLSSELVGSLQARVMLAVRAGTRARRARDANARVARDVAARHCQRLVFMPDNQHPEQLDDARTRRSLTAIAPFLTRPGS